MRALRIWSVSHWVVLLGITFLLRIVIAPFAYGFQYDMDTFGNWGNTLVEHPFEEFYARAESPDHLPGDLYLHFVLARVFEALGGDDFHGDTYRYLLKVVPVVADVLVALTIWAFVRQWLNEESARMGALIYALNPATIFLSAVWGQWDVVSGLIMLTGLVIVWALPSRWLLAIPVFALAVMIKPPLALLCLIGLFAIPLRELRRARPAMVIARKLLASVAAAGLIGVASIIVLIMPFDTGLPGMGTRWSLPDRINVAVDLYPFTTLGAANIWMIPLGSPDRQRDVDGSFLGVNELGWGSFLLVAALLYIVTLLTMKWRSIEPVRLVTWAMATAGYAYFMLPTRSHERYLYPAVLLLILLAALCRMERRAATVAMCVSLVYFLNLAGVYYGLPGILQPVLFVTLSLLNVVLFAVVALFPFWWRGDGEDEAEVAGTPMPVYADDTNSELLPA